ncbi:MAG: hypothetical protein ACFCUN_10485 [Hyphomicrobiaceae bacterium]
MASAQTVAVAAAVTVYTASGSIVALAVIALAAAGLASCLIAVFGARIARSEPDLVYPMGRVAEIVFWSEIMTSLAYSVAAGVAIGLVALAPSAEDMAPPARDVTLAAYGIAAATIAIAGAALAAATPADPLRSAQRALRQPRVTAAPLHLIGTLLAVGAGALGIAASGAANRALMEFGGTLATAAIATALAIHAVLTARVELAPAGAGAEMRDAIRDIVVAMPEPEEAGVVVHSVNVVALSAGALFASIEASFPGDVSAHSITRLRALMDARVKGHFPQVAAVALVPVALPTPSDAREPSRTPISA